MTATNGVSVTFTKWPSLAQVGENENGQAGRFPAGVIHVQGAGDERWSTTA